MALEPQRGLGHSRGEAHRRETVDSAAGSAAPQGGSRGSVDAYNALSSDASKSNSQEAFELAPTRLEGFKKSGHTLPLFGADRVTRVACWRSTFRLCTAMRSGGA